MQSGTQVGAIMQFKNEMWILIEWTDEGREAIYNSVATDRWRDVIGTAEL